MKRIILGLVLIVSLFFLVGCTAPYIQEVKFEDDYIAYNETAILNYRIYNPASTSFEGIAEIRAVTSTGFFNCFESTEENISTTLPKKSSSGELEIKSLENPSCKGYTFDVYFTLKDLNSDNTITKKIVPLNIND